MEKAFSEIEVDKKVHELTGKVRLSRQNLEKSLFYKEAMKQLQKPEMVAQIKRVIGTNSHHSQLQVVIYGLGSLEPNTEFFKSANAAENYAEIHCIQLAFAILLREKFEWVNDIVVYDPIQTLFDVMAINSLKCTCLSVDEQCKRTVDRPTLFFLPHLPWDLIENVLKANSTPSQLNKIIILGNSFIGLPLSNVRDHLETIFNSTHRQHEFPLRASDQLADLQQSSPEKYPELDPDPLISRAFHRLSWQFFVDLDVNRF
jgi:hypothetical protein